MFLVQMDTMKFFGCSNLRLVCTLCTRSTFFVRSTTRARQFFHQFDWSTAGRLQPHLIPMAFVGVSSLDLSGLLPRGLGVEWRGGRLGCAVLVLPGAKLESCGGGWGGGGGQVQVIKVSKAKV